MHVIFRIYFFYLLQVLFIIFYNLFYKINVIRFIKIKYF